MGHEIARSANWQRLLLQAVVAAFGVIGIVGSGGGGDCIGCDVDIDHFPVGVTVNPERLTVQVGATVSLVSTTIFGNPPLSYQWRRNGVDIAGATGATYTLAGANLGDDGAQFEIRVTAGNGVATATSLLWVSPAPGVVYEDVDFAMSDWAVTAVADPPQNGPTHAEAQSATGGSPGAFRSVAYQMPAGPSSILVLHTASSSVYDPAAQGALNTVDLALDCNRLSASTGGSLEATPAFEQGSRWFTPRLWMLPCVGTWRRYLASSLRPDEFTLLAGPACSANEACPDFSISAAPLRFGFASSIKLGSGEAAGSITQGIDNWRVTIWRK